MTTPNKAMGDGAQDIPMDELARRPGYRPEDLAFMLRDMAAKGYDPVKISADFAMEIANALTRPAPIDDGGLRHALAGEARLGAGPRWTSDRLKELLERMVRAGDEANGYVGPEWCYAPQEALAAEAALAALEYVAFPSSPALPGVTDRDAVLEEAAKIAEAADPLTNPDTGVRYVNVQGEYIAHAIRALKSPAALHPKAENTDSEDAGSGRSMR